MDVTIQNLSSWRIPFALVNTSQLAILLSFADYVFDAVFNGLLLEVSVEGRAELDVSGDLSKSVSISHLFLTHLEAFDTV